MHKLAMHVNKKAARHLFDFQLISVEILKLFLRGLSAIKRLILSSMTADPRNEQSNVNYLTSRKGDCKEDPKVIIQTLAWAQARAHKLSFWKIGRGRDSNLLA